MRHHLRVSRWLQVLLNHLLSPLKTQDTILSISKSINSFLLMWLLSIEHHEIPGVDEYLGRVMAELLPWAQHRFGLSVEPSERRWAILWYQAFWHSKHDKTWQNKVCFHVFAPFRDYRLVILDCNLWVPMVEPGPSGADTLAVPLSVAFVLCTWRWDFQAGNRLSCNQRKIEPNDHMLTCLNVQFSNGSFRHSSLSGDSFHPHF